MTIFIMLHGVQNFFVLQVPVEQEPELQDLSLD